ncbi:MAG: carboxypeptidase-like regulatory domain-containing protein [Thermoplasmata archaeon]|nr:carboxypeptidase-like regulatory domain-containing protein [Thermoplasmata archaeon]
MAAVWATARCITCGAPVAVLVPPTPGARWFTCPQCHSPMPVVPPTNPPPIFSWEIYPQVYPAPPPLRMLGRPISRLATIALVSCVLLLAGLAGALALSGEEALGPTTFRLSGTVELAANHDPVGGAIVSIGSETGWTQSFLTGGNGSFHFVGIPTGGATINVTAPGMAPVTLGLFFSPTFTSPGTGPTGLALLLAPGNAGNASTDYETPFPDLESFVSSVWSASVLLALGAIVAAAGAWMAYRGTRPTVGVAGGLSAAVAPFGLTLLGITTAFPLAALPAAAAVGLGLVGAVLELLPVINVGRAADLG